MASDIAAQLDAYLSDAYSIEQQALAQLRAAPAIAGDERLAAAFREHERETERQSELIAARLEARGASPSKLKDAVMAIGGAGFVLFAQSQPDTPGKLCAHAHSYEALEEAAYELLLRVAEQAGDHETAAVARAIRDEERAMRERLERLFDVAVDASLRDTDLVAQERAYLADAHALEAQSIALLQRAPRLVADNELALACVRHREESEQHQRRIAAHLQTLGGEPSGLKDAALRLGGLNWSLFFKAQPDTPGKLAAFVYAVEHLESAAYDLLALTADRAADADGARLARTIAEEERAMAARVASLWDRAIESTLRAQGIAT